jgi:hypothetical protein
MAMDNSPARAHSPFRSAFSIARSRPASRIYGRRAENALASPEAKTRRCPVGVIETSAALGACLLLLERQIAMNWLELMSAERNGNWVRAGQLSMALPGLERELDLATEQKRHPEKTTEADL